MLPDTADQGFLIQNVEGNMRGIVKIRLADVRSDDTLFPVLNSQSFGEFFSDLP